MTKRASSQLTIEVISPYFTQSIQTASKKLGVCCTLLKKICRKYGITRWPYRKIQSIERSIQQTKERLQFLEQYVAQEKNGNAYNEMLKLRTELFELERKRESLLRPDKSLINPYSLEPNYLISLNAKELESLEKNSSLWSHSATQETAQHRRTMVEEYTDHSGNMRPLSPILSLDSSEPECSAHSSSCYSRPMSRFPKCEGFEDYDSVRLPLEVTSEVTAYSEADSPLKRNNLIVSNTSLEYHQDSSYELPGWNMQWGRDSVPSGKIQEDMRLQQTGSCEKLPRYVMHEDFSHSPATDEDPRLANRFLQLPLNSRDTLWNRMRAFGTLNNVPDRENCVKNMKPFSGMEGQTMYNTFPDDMILSHVTSTDDMSTIDENMSYSGGYEKRKPMKQDMGIFEGSWESAHIQKTLSSVYRRMEHLEQENQRLRSKLSRLLASFPVQTEETKGEQGSFYKGFPSNQNTLMTGMYGGDMLERS
ncbi:Protein NLP7 [Galdieria sulphuraria]|uniref:Transcription factor n=1 Tax=Galdieria sulphuraria TaxID=130081 RepID=M2XDE9_GALSU|nr:transcription factor [Galdieria sulphuraria]EME27997.1 transcription factor [Galdieria sulphuraria]GJD11775.1 Protein NLP7 [Galdieria sulphuraria]|eukprot:XP_005704517.1 transcription factor [Galdieria sulphuraria]